MERLLIAGFPAITSVQAEMLEQLQYQLIIHPDERAPLPPHALLCEAVVCNGLFQYHDIASWQNLRFIQLLRAGLDGLPLTEIRYRGITLCNARGVYSVPIAEWIVLKVLELYRESGAFYAQQQQGLWQKRRDLRELCGRTAGIVGTGSIGMEAAARLAAFGVRLIGVDLAPPSSSFERLIHPDALPETIGEMDIVILTLPLTAETEGFFGRDLLFAMKPGAVLINCARGRIVDEDALLKALNHGPLSGAALDVFAHEPLPPESPLWHHPRVVVTPHNSFISDQNPRRLWELIFQNLQNYRGGRALINQITG